jgi:threonylcarbamoyladenosine tRNA methylthiotransferase MtaB
MGKAQLIVTSCSRRSLEIEQVKCFLQGNGFSLSNDDWNVDPDADLVLLSTCGFTNAAEDFGFETLRRVQATKKPGAKIVFGGCIPEINPDRVLCEFDGPTFSPQSYSKLNEIIGARHRFDEFKRPNTFDNSSTPSLIQDAQKAIEILKTFDGSFSGLEYVSRRLSNGLRRKLIRSRYANLNSHNTFYIQVQEGCSMCCTYCAIRMAIGRLRSRPIETLLNEFEAGLDKGYKHFQLVGDNAGSYGLDIGTNMGKLLECLLMVKRDFVLDLTDINPVYLPIIYEPVKQLCVEGKLSRLYVPIQSGNKRILKLMGRDCDLGAVKQMLLEIKRLAPPEFKLGTSLVVGFPSETIEELNDTLRFCDEADFDWIWCHSFSAKSETPAVLLAGQITADEILRRAQLVKSWLGRKSLVTTADDSVGSRTCQG